MLGEKSCLCSAEVDDGRGRSERNRKVEFLVVGRESMGTGQADVLARLTTNSLI